MTPCISKFSFDTELHKHTSYFSVLYSFSNFFLHFPCFICKKLLLSGLSSSTQRSWKLFFPVRLKKLVPTLPWILQTSGILSIFSFSGELEMSFSCVSTRIPYRLSKRLSQTIGGPSPRFTGDDKTIFWEYFCVLTSLCLNEEKFRKIQKWPGLCFAELFPVLAGWRRTPQLASVLPLQLQLPSNCQSLSTNSEGFPK